MNNTKSKINIAIVNTMPFPSGFASVNRIMSYSKGLVKLGVNVTVLSTSAGYDLDFHYIDGIRYKSLRLNQKNKFTFFAFFIALSRVIKSIFSERHNYNIVILVSNSVYLIYPIFILCKLFSIKIIQEKSEFPFVLNSKSLLGRIYAKIYVNTTYKLFDGLIVMTKPLVEYFRKKARKNCRIIEMPMTVDCDRFKSITPYKPGYEYIAYCGDMGGNKDGISNLITSFSFIYKKYPDIKLLLIGNTSDVNELNRLKRQIDENKIQNIIFYGKADRADIPSILCGAKILALARPTSLQSTGGFPTKLGEYLSTGKPVVVTSVGDIPRYLNTENSYIVKPDDNRLFADKIIEILDNYDNALEIGRKGQQLALSVFDYKAQSNSLATFLEDFIIK